MSPELRLTTTHGENAKAGNTIDYYLLLECYKHLLWLWRIWELLLFYEKCMSKQMEFFKTVDQTAIIKTNTNYEGCQSKRFSSFFSSTFLFLLLLFLRIDLRFNRIINKLAQ